MSSDRYRPEKGFGLRPEGHHRALSCGPEGPRLGPIALLTKGANGFAPRPSDELDFILSYALGEPAQCSRLTASLKVIAQALDRGELARAMIATQQMRLAPLTEAQAARAVEAEALAKAGFNPAQTRWPAGSPGSVGGQFAPKDMADQNQMLQGPEFSPVERAAAKELTRKVIRRAIRGGLRFLLKPSRVAREALEGLSNFIPGVDAIGDAMAVKDAIQTAAKVGDLTREVRAALDFINHGPQELDALKMIPKSQTRFTSFGQFKKNDDNIISIHKVYGAAPPGWEYHHIVEQVAGVKLPPELLNSVDNIILLPKLLHEEVTAAFASSVMKNGVRMPLRQSLAGESFEAQYRAGVQVLRNAHIIK